MTWFDKKYNEYVETKLKQIVEDERFNKKSKRTIQQQENDNGIVIIILIVLGIILVCVLRNWNLVTG